jgi:mannose-6-phosphate isomerase-like protein (cupin superfamily)
MNSKTRTRCHERLQLCLRQIKNSVIEAWTDPAQGLVERWTVFSADRTPTSGSTTVIAETPVGAPRPDHAQLHKEIELNYFVSGRDEVVIDGVSRPFSFGDAVMILGGVEHVAVNTGQVLLRLRHVFAVDLFYEVVYEFPYN